MNTKDKYDKVAKIYDRMEKMLFFNKYRKDLISLAQGEVLEVGVGTGANLPYYSEKTSVIGIDFSKNMLEKSKKVIKKNNITNIKLKEMDVQTMAFEDNSFDCAVSTCVFCTVPDPVAGLKEIYRVIKPGGKVLFLEHMRSKNPLINIFLFMMNIMSKFFLGTSMIRKTQKNIEKSGFKITERKDLFFDVVRIIIAEKDL
ncbi:class I SAM-dependent methyltransferase [Ilyobacter polytropus]|uniref:Methyltransferase type 11 n=1 Tax=Ilyobacter polytropus (strain ATCC 51220 / DSM 2926 / LMG 16218 / CuHBu1) TaxID=572544 RepID=E3H6X0_ILYPC|nr:methyltransferase domain-containing protein [Ilyobacter polytropus]ADO82489.1 Methyltransferase type 11 [Ilyobacter polytropus DSM 2926]